MQNKASQLCLILLLIFNSSFAQTAENTPIEIIGTTAKIELNTNNPKPIGSVKISIYRDSSFYLETTADKKGAFSFKLAYGAIYTVVFTEKKSLSIHLIVDAKNNISKEVMAGHEMAITMYDAAEDRINKTLYKRYPFAIYRFKKNSIEPDENYFQNFQKDKLPFDAPYKNHLTSILDQLNKPKTVEAEKLDTIGIAGYLVCGGDANIPAKSITLNIIGDKKGVVNTAITTNNGEFYLSKIGVNTDISIKGVGEAVKKYSKVKITLFGKNGKELGSVLSNTDGSFTLIIPYTDKDAINALKTDKNIKTIAGNMLAVINNISEPIANTKIQALGKNGNLLEATFTNDLGGFVFTEIPADEGFLLQLAENNIKLANNKIMITNKDGKELLTTKANNSGGFKFEFLKPDEYNMKELQVDVLLLKININGKLILNDKIILANTNIELLNDSGRVVKTTTTDASGRFTFKYIISNAVYSLKINKAGGKIFLKNSADEVVKETITDKAKNNTHITLLPVDIKKLGAIFVDDPWLKVIDATTENALIPEKVYFDFNDSKITATAQVILDKVALVLQKNKNITIDLTAHTDSKGAAQQNLELSKKRAESTVNYILTKGIDKLRIKGSGLGETKIINKCKDNVYCTEDEHAQNRRIDFSISQLKK